MAAVTVRIFSKFSQPALCYLGMSQSYFQSNIIARLLYTSKINNVEGIPIKMPSLSPTMMEGTIIKWMKNEGDTVQAGDILCDIQTDKAVVSLETDEEGILAKILKGDDSKDIKIGTLIALMVAEGEDWKNVTIPASEDMTDAAVQPAQPSKADAATSVDVSVGSHYGPSVKLLLEKYGLTSDQVPANGPHGILLKGDILQYVKEKNVQPKLLEKVSPPAAATPATLSAAEPKPVTTPKTVIPGVQFDDIELTSMRKTIAKRLSHSKSTIAHTYSTLECCADAMLNLRKQFKKDGISVSVNDFIIKCVAVALTRCPEINTVWEGDQLIQKREVDISVAVATDAGLITPIVKGADRLGIESISETVRDLAGRARQNKLRLNEFQGGTFTISNLGMFGISEFTAIINPPQCAILAVGGSRIALGLDGKPETRMRATLSYDQAAISDDAAAAFLENLTELLENPQQILLGSYAKRVDHPMAALL